MSGPKLLTEAEVKGMFLSLKAEDIIDQLRERGLIEQEPVDPLEEEARKVLEGWVEGGGGQYVCINFALAVLRRGMELVERPTLTREMVEAAFDNVRGCLGVERLFVDALHAALSEQLK